MRSGQNFRYLVGMTLDEAQAVHDNIRVLDSNVTDTTIDETRLNVVMTDGKISEVQNFG